MATPADPARSTRPSPGPPAPQPPDDWPAQAADAVVNAVDTVKARTTGPLLTAARGVVFGLLIAVAGLIAFILVLIAATRFLNYWMPVWATYLVIGALLTVTGAIVFHKRHAPDLS